MQGTFVPWSNFEVCHFAHHFLFLSFIVVMKGIQFTQLRCHISFLLFTCFLSSYGKLLNSHKLWLFCLHIQHATCCLFQQRTPVVSSETAVCGFCLSISQHPSKQMFGFIKKQSICKYDSNFSLPIFILNYIKNNNLKVVNSNY